MTDHHLSQIITARGILADAAGFLSAMVLSGRLDPAHHAAAERIIANADAFRATPLFPPSTTAPSGVENRSETVCNGDAA